MSARKTCSPGRPEYSPAASARDVRAPKGTASSSGVPANVRTSIDSGNPAWMESSRWLLPEPLSPTTTMPLVDGDAMAPTMSSRSCRRSGSADGPNPAATVSSSSQGSGNMRTPISSKSPLFGEKVEFPRARIPGLEAGDGWGESLGLRRLCRRRLRPGPDRLATAGAPAQRDHRCDCCDWNSGDAWG